MIRNNPEFIKNVKLECNMLRFIIPLALLLLFVWIGLSAEAQNHAWMDQYTVEQLKAKSLFSWLCGFGFLFTIVWGTYLTTNSMLEEIKTKTWDFVRMSSLPPLKILVGKIFGTPSIAWMITLLGVLPFIYYAGFNMIPGTGYIRPELITITVLVVCLFFWILLSYALSMLMSLVNEGTQGRTNNVFSGTLAVLLLGLMVGGWIMEAFRPFYAITRYASNNVGPKGPLPTDMAPLPNGAFAIEPSPLYLEKPPTLHWYGTEIFSLDALTMVLAFFGIWTFCGAWRALRKSLQYKDAPWLWVLFIVSASLFLSGFDFIRMDHDLRQFQGNLFWIVFIGMLTMTLTCVSEGGNIIKYRSFAQKISTRSFYAAFREMPLWMISFIAFSVGIVINILYPQPDLLPRQSQQGQANLFFISLFVFAVRDLLVFHVISWTPNLRRPVIGLIIYAVVIYGLLPLLANTIDKDYGYVFFPLFDRDGGGVYWQIIGCEIVVAAYMFAKRWKLAFGRK